MKTAVVVDFDTRRVLFQKIVASLRLFSSMDSWDLSWGEPFLAVTKDKRVWVRVFYEESAPASAEKFKGEVERLLPHLSADGELIFCLPQSWNVNFQDVLPKVSTPIRIWNYSGLSDGAVFAHEMKVEKSVLTLPVMVSEVSGKELPHSAQRLSTEEVRELAEMGLAMKRFNIKQVS